MIPFKKCQHCDLELRGEVDPRTADENVHVLMNRHMISEHKDKLFLCPRRAESHLSSLAGEGDYWDVMPNGDRTCSYCGSLSEDDFVDIMQSYVDGVEGFSFERSTKSYKTYAKRPGVSNAGSGGIKFYHMHVDKDHPKIQERMELFRKAVEKSREEFKKRWGK